MTSPSLSWFPTFKIVFKTFFSLALIRTSSQAVSIICIFDLSSYKRLYVCMNVCMYVFYV